MTATGKRVGRPRNPSPPRSPEPYERQLYVDRLQNILDALEISDLTKEVQLYLQKTLRGCEVVRSINPALAPTKGDEKVTILLRAVFESSNGAAALTLPVLMAVSNCMRPVWVDDQGLVAWIESFDRVDLIGLHRSLIELGLADQLSRALHVKLEQILGVPTATPAKPVRTKKLSARATRATGRPKRAADQHAMMAA